MKIRKGQEVLIKPEWQDEGDDQFQFIALENLESGMTEIKVRCDLGLRFPHVSYIRLDHIAEVRDVEEDEETGCDENEEHRIDNCARIMGVGRFNY